MRTLTKIGTALLCTAAAATAAAIPATAATSSPRTTAQTADTVVLDCQGQAQTQPGTYLLACGDGNNYLTGIHWTAWTADSATATATDNANDCQPNCAAGRFHGYPVTVTLDEPRSASAGSGPAAYTHVTLHYTGDRPDGVPATVSAPLPVPQP
ncbi:hypothetical protein [Streptacidiphilus anmyonensis]|uniref:hypothetical protein n=1 Tax=Streptacidiphilus anmyonensis TaxID=405782 RepID=UPI0005A890F8|nr:hypothetical protein [Streptacidiphilus anmyonensis]